MALDPSTLLDQVETAITALLTGQHSSYSIGSRSVTKLDLDQLFRERAILQKEVARDAGSSTFKVAKFTRTTT